MANVICLDEKYSTTRMLFKIINNECLDEDGKIKEECKWNIDNLELNIKDSKLIGNPEDKFETTLFLPEGEGRKGEGGLRTKGYFKKSFEDKPLISIITVVFNGEKYLEETIQSVINQTYDNVEYIIIDGGSTDGTLDIIKKYEDQIDYWVSEKDNGIYDAMNKGIDLAAGKWINFMNAGDRFYNKKVLDKIVTKLFSDIVCAYGNARWKNGKKAFPFCLPYILRMPNHQTMFTKSDWLKKNKFDLTYSICADLDSKMKIDSINGFYKIDELVCICEDGGISQDPLNLSKVQKEMILIHKKYHYLTWPYVILDRFYIFIKKILNLKYKSVKNV